MSRKEIIRKAAMWTGFWIAVGIAGGGILFGLAQSPWGKRQLGAAVGQLLTQGEQTVAVGAIKGLIPFQMTVQSVEVRDSDGPWLSIDDISVKWAVLSLIKGRVHLDALQAKQMVIHRLPAQRAETMGDPDRGVSPVRILTRVRVDRLDIAHLELGAAIAGRKEVLRFRGKVGSPSREGGFVSEATLQPEGSGESRVFLRIHHGEGETRVAVDAKLTGASGRAAARALGVPGPLEATLEGDGTLTRWQGRLSLDVGPWGLMETDIRIQEAGERTLESTGSLQPRSGILPRPMRPWIPAKMPFSLSGHWKGAVLSLDRLEIRAKDIALFLQGEMNLKTQHSVGSLRADFQSLEPLGIISGETWAGRGTVRCDFSGPPRQPEGTIRAEVHSLKLGGGEVDSARARFQVVFLEPWNSPFPQVRVSASGRGEGLRLGKKEVEPEIQWFLEMETQGDGSLRFERLYGEGKFASIDARGTLRGKTKAGKLQAAIHLRDARAYEHLIGYRVPAAATCRIQMEGSLSRRAIEAQVAGELKGLDSGGKALTLLGPEAGYTADVRLAADGSISVSNGRFWSPVFMIFGEGTAEGGGGGISGSWRAEIPRLEPVSALVGRRLGGGADLEGTVSGNGEEVRVSAHLQATDLSVDTVRVGDLEADGSFIQKGSERNGDIRLALHRQEQTYGAEGPFQVSEGRVEFHALAVEGPATHLEGRFVYDHRRGRTAGELEGACTDLSELLGGKDPSWNGAVRLEALWEHAEETQSARLALAGNSVFTPYGASDRLSVEAELQQVAGNVYGTVVFDAEGIRSGGAHLSRFTVDAHRSPGDQAAVFGGRLEGRHGRELQARFRGRLEEGEGNPVLRITDLEGRYGASPVSLNRPLELIFHGIQPAAGDADLAVGQGELQCSFAYQTDEIQLSMKSREVPVEVMLEGLAGRMSGELRISGSPESPEGGMSLVLTALRWKGPSVPELPPARLEARVGLNDGRLEVDSELEGFGPGPLKATATLPLRVSFRPPAGHFDRDQAIEGEIQGSVNLAYLNLFPILGAHQVEGIMNLDLVLDGPLAGNFLNGSAHLESGGYEHLRSGTILKNIKLALSATDRKIILKEARGDDGGDGSLEAHGWLSWDAGAEFPFEVQMELTRMKIVGHDYASVSADGNFSMSGTFLDAVLSGELEVTHGEFRLPRRLSADIAHVKVKELDVAGREIIPDETPAKDRKRNIDLEVAVVSDGQVFLRGRGLDSEWAGELNVQGSTGAPVIRGSLSAVRGRLSFLGKPFKITRGLIQFAGESPPNPQITLVAESQAQEITAQLMLSGLIRSPKMELTSDPSLPQDEILSHLLFGRDISTLGVAQALQLAYAVNSLSGGGGFDLLGSTREFLGVDQLIVSGTGEGVEGTRVGAGKYLAEGVYLEVQRGLTPESGKATLELELTPQLSVSTEIWENSQGGVGLNWRWNY